MNIFSGFNQSTPCPICGTTEDKKAVLIPVSGTEKDELVECIQVHLDCIELTVYRNEQQTWLMMGFNEKYGEHISVEGI